MLFFSFHYGGPGGWNSGYLAMAASAFTKRDISLVSPWRLVSVIGLAPPRIIWEEFQ